MLQGMLQCLGVKVLSGASRLHRLTLVHCPFCTFSVPCLQRPERNWTSVTLPASGCIRYTVHACVCVKSHGSYCALKISPTSLRTGSRSSTTTRFTRSSKLHHKSALWRAFLGSLSWLWLWSSIWYTLPPSSISTSSVLSSPACAYSRWSDSHMRGHRRTDSS